MFRLCVILDNGSLIQKHNCNKKRWYQIQCFWNHLHPAQKTNNLKVFGGKKGKGSKLDSKHLLGSLKGYFY